MERKKIVVALTGASGAGYGFELIRALSGSDVELSVIYNDTALMILQGEHGVGLRELERFPEELVHTSRMDHELASGSNRFDSMVLCPCSTSTASKISSGIADNLTTRCAAVALKEEHKVILAVRETPLSTPVLRSLLDLSTWGVTIMPISPPLYGISNGSVRDLMKGFSGRIMDLLGVNNDLAERYEPDPKDKER
ncbi:MAG: UbiX family flavin prenyltransferase [Thermoplasmatota archaeon]